MLATLMRDPLLLLTMLALGVFLISVIAVSAKMAFLAVMMTFVFTATLWGSPGLGALDVRPLSILCLVLQGIQAARASKGRYPLSSKAKPFIWSMIVFGLYALTTTFWSSNPSKTLQSTAAWFLLIGLVVVFPQLVSSFDITRILKLFLIIIVVVSATLALVRYPDAWNGGRLRGIMLTANGMGIFCMFASPFFLLSQRKVMKVAWLIPVILVVFTGSRAAAAGLLVGTAFILWRSTAPHLRLLVYPTLAAGIFAMYLSAGSAVLSGNSSLVILRDNNSREQVWQDALATHSAHPWFGLGMGALPTESGSSYLKVLSETGYVGFTLAAIVLVTALRSAWSSRLASSFLVAGVVAASFEGWLFTAGSVYAAFFFMIVASCARSAEDYASPADRSHSRPHADSDPPGAVAATSIPA